MQQIVGGAQPGALELGGPARADTLQEPQLTLQRVTRRFPGRVCGHRELLRREDRSLDISKG